MKKLSLAIFLLPLTILGQNNVGQPTVTIQSGPVKGVDGTTIVLNAAGIASAVGGAGTNGGTVTNFSTGIFPAWLTPTVTGPTLNPVLSIAGNSAMSNLNSGNGVGLTNLQPGSVSNNLTIPGVLTVAGETNSSTLGVAGAATLASTLGVTGTTTLGNQTNTGTLGVAGASTLAGAVNANGVTANNANISNYLAQSIGTLSIASTTNVTVDFHNPDVETASTLTANVNLLQTTNRTASVESKHIVWLYPNGTNRTISFNSSWHGNVLGTLGTSQANITLTNSTFASVVFSCNGSTETNICFVYSVWQ